MLHIFKWGICEIWTSRIREVDSRCNRGASRNLMARAKCLPLLTVYFDQAGTGFGAMLSAVHGFNTGIPYLQNHVKGPKWLSFVVGLPPLLLFSGASAAFGGSKYVIEQ